MILTLQTLNGQSDDAKRLIGPVQLLVDGWGDAPFYAERGVLVLGRRVVEPTIDAAQMVAEQKNPEAEARTYYNANLAEKVSEHPKVAGWLGPNEVKCSTAEEMTWYGRFEAERTRLLHAAGKIAIVGNFGTGQPEPELWSYFFAAFDAVPQAWWKLGLHEYGSRHRPTWDTYLIGRFTRLPGAYRLVPIIITETGTDDTKEVHHPDTGALIYVAGLPWTEEFKDDMPGYGAWLADLDRLYRGHSCIEGVCVFAACKDHSVWSRHNVEGTGLVDHLLAARDAEPPSPTPAPVPVPPIGGSSMYPTGKGMFIWQLKNCAGGDPARLAAMAAASGIKWVSIKIADGIVSFNGDISPAVRALKAAGVSVWGWSYVYGYRPEDEARRAIDRCNYHGLDGYHLNAEHEYKQAGRAVMAKRMMDVLRMSAPALPVGLCSYRFPSLHSEFPWKEFLDGCTHHAPQVYWLENDSSLAPGGQLARSVRELKLKRDLPIVPLGVASPNDAGTWLPSIPQLDNFHAAVKSNGLPGWGYWSWEHAERRPEVWAAIARHGALPTPVPTPEGGDMDIEKVLEQTAIIKRAVAEIEALAGGSAPTGRPAPLFSVRITTVTLNVRSGPSPTFNDIGDLHADDVVPVYVVASNGWYRISASDRISVSEPARWISGSTQYSTRVPSGPVPTPTPVLPDTRGLRVDEWRIEKTTVGVGEDCWFNFTVVNKQPQGLPLTVAVLGAYADDGTVAPSFTHYTLSPSAVLTHRDHINFGIPGTKQIKLGVKFSDNDTAFVRLSGPFTVTVV